MRRSLFLLFSFLIAIITLLLNFTLKSPKVAQLTDGNQQYICLANSKNTNASVTPASNSVRKEDENPDIELSVIPLKLNNKDLEFSCSCVLEDEHFTAIENKQPKVDEEPFSISDVHSAFLQVPSYALAEGVQLAIEPLTQSQLPVLDSALINVTTVRSGFRFLPAGTQFAKEVKVAISFDTTFIPEGYTVEDVRTFYYDTKLQNWQMLPKDTLIGSILVSLTTHFTDMITGILKVPETPATAAYTPTTLSDIKAADPGLGIQQISPPSASSTGSLDLQFPLDLPQGRAGITPAIGLRYSSDGGDGWIGTGWNLGVSSIEVESRWGVPLYSAAEESETYTMDGGQLSPVAHRGEYVARSAEKQFYPRIEGAFQQIIRHGSTPKNYWWEITSPSGHKSYYGGSPSGGVKDEAILKDKDGNIARWYLTESRDLNGNKVTYKYEKKQHSNYRGTGEDAYQHYLKNTNYTATDNENGLYDISFIRDVELGESSRTNISLNARQGYLHLEQELLRKIEIRFQGELLRSYDLQYEDGVFGKKLLQKIGTYDAAGVLFYSHSFDYYTDVADDFFGPEQNYNPLGDNLRGDFINPISNFDDRVSSIGGTKSSGYSVGGSVSIGPLASPPFKLFTVGGSYNYSSSNSESVVTLMDMNGDGIPDKVFKKGGKLWYRPGIRGSSQIFDDAVQLQGAPSDFMHSKSSTNSKGFNAYFVVTGGSNKSTTTSQTDIFISDFNSDGLPDIAYKGMVFFNVLRNGHPTFEITSDNTYNPVTTSGAVDPALLPDAAALTQEQAEQNPLHNSIRVWQAPYPGNINLQAPVRLLPPTTNDSIAEGFDTRDGIRATVQKDNGLLWNTTIGAENFSDHYCNLNIFVNKGDKIYFRLQSMANGVADHVLWNPEINYMNPVSPLTDINQSNADNKRYSYYKASEDHALFLDKPLELPKEGNITLDIPFSKGKLSDSLWMQIFYTPPSSAEEIFYEEMLNPESIVDMTYQFTKNVEAGASFRFTLSSKSTIDWSAVKGFPVVTYTSIIDTVPVAVTDALGRPQFQYYGLFGAVMYDNEFLLVKPFIAESSFTALVIPLVGVSNPSRLFGDTISLTLKDRNDLWIQQDMWFDTTSVRWFDSTTFIYAKANNVADTLFRFTFNQGDTLFAEYRIHKESFAQGLDFTGWALVYLDNSGNPVDTVLLTASVYLPKDPNEQWYGHLYRGWGAFVYNEKDNYSSAPMDLNAINTDIGKLRNMSSHDFSDLASGQTPSETRMAEIEAMIYKPEDARYIMMYPNAQRKRYEGFMPECYVGDSVQGTCRFGMQDVVVQPVIHTAGTFPTIIKQNKNTNDSWSLGISYGGAGITYNEAKGKTDFISDLLDMNGDGYPDIYSHSQVQYTGVLGGLKYTRSMNIEKNVGESKIKTVSANGSGVKAKMPTLFPFSQGAIDAASQAQNSVSASGNFGEGEDEAPVEWVDINGDGLPDRVYKDGTVQLNMGYRFTNRTAWESRLTRGETKDYGAGLGISLFAGSFSSGISLSRGETEGQAAMMDINGDGLPDMVWRKNEHDFYAKLNRGTDFGAQQSFSGTNPLSKGVNTGEAVNGAFSIYIPIPIPFFPIKLVIGVDGGANHGASREQVSFTDMNGDGYPDWVYSDRENELKVRYAQIGRMNLLKNVQCPLKASYTFDYKQTQSTLDDPNSRWALASLKVFDGFISDGIDTLRKIFTYENPRYERYERVFLGFEKVITQELDDNLQPFRILLQTYDNSNVYQQGALLTELLTDKNGTPLNSTVNQYVMINPGNFINQPYVNFYYGRLWPQLKSSQSIQYEGTNSVAIQKQYEYDQFGNITTYTENTPQDALTVTVTYQHDNSRYIHSWPRDFNLSQDGNTLRQRSATYDTRGNLISLAQKIDNRTAVLDFEYDSYGNITKVTRPTNYRGQRMWYKFTYDPVHHDLVTRIEDAFGYTSSTTYEYRYKQPLHTIDINREEMHYAYDIRGRLTAVRGPYNTQPDLTFEYFHNAAVPYAHTIHQLDSVNTLSTYTFIDGLSRPVQLKKTAVIDNNHKIMQVSGKIEYDAFGQEVKNYLPFFEELGNESTLNNTPSMYPPSIKEYDTKDRVAKEILPDGTPTLMSYDIEDALQKQTITNALGYEIKVWSNMRDQKLKQQQEEVITTFRYNVLGELLESIDPNGNSSFFEYDMLGKVLSTTHPDAGKTEMQYDLAGNLVKKITPMTRQWASSQSDPASSGIIFTYDYERPFEIIYPKNIQNRVTYSYGAPGDSLGRVGRMTLVQDASGGQEFFYGKLGEVTKSIRSVLASRSELLTYIWTAEYDTWGRIKKMGYPDGEIVNYTYNEAGELLSFKGLKDEHEYPYIQESRYDIYGNLIYQRMGDGSEHTYTYDPLRQRLMTMELKGRNGVLMFNQYAYDAIDNITDLTNAHTRHHYEYDPINRLAKANGSSEGVTYSLLMDYDKMGNVLQKNQQVSSGDITNHNLFYKYEGSQPNAPTTIGNRKYEYDLCGNPTLWVDEDKYRRMLWDEENRLMLIDDNAYMSRYVYDHTGERVVKQHGYTTGVYVNGKPQGVLSSNENSTLYVSPYFTVSKNGKEFTKHYVAGTKRVASKMGVGRFQNLFKPGVFGLTAGGVNYIDRMNQIMGARNAYGSELGLPPGPPHAKYGYYEPDYTGIAYPDAGTPQDNTPPPNWPRLPIGMMDRDTSAGVAPGPPIIYGDYINNYTAQAGFAYFGSGGAEEKNVYYYHTDHLGSTNYVTDRDGRVSQFIVYLPFGESLVERHSNTRDMPYLFNGKERDEETGLYYYGARYYDPWRAQFLNVDPMWTIYPNFGGYVYCANNPIILLDPTGNWIETAWDVFSLGVGVTSFVNNVKEGNVRSAILDGIGIIADAAAVVAPVIPGGVGVAIKAARAGDKAIDVVKTANKIDKASNVRGVAVKADNVTDVMKNRVKLRKGTKEAIQDAAPKTKDGRFIDPNTGRPIEKGQEVFGHKKGQEWNKYKKDPANQNKTRKEVIEDQNKPGIYQIEDRRSNASHKYESKSLK